MLLPSSGTGPSCSGGGRAAWGLLAGEKGAFVGSAGGCPEGCLVSHARGDRAPGGCLPAPGTVSRAGGGCGRTPAGPSLAPPPPLPDPLTRRCPRGSPPGPPPPAQAVPGKAAARPVSSRDKPGWARDGSPSPGLQAAPRAPQSPAPARGSPHVAPRRQDYSSQEALRAAEKPQPMGSSLAQLAGRRGARRESGAAGPRERTGRTTYPRMPREGARPMGGGRLGAARRRAGAGGRGFMWRSGAPREGSGAGGAVGFGGRRARRGPSRGLRAGAGPRPTGRLSWGR